MARSPREIRDPIHNFVRVSGAERRVMDSAPFQRLRSIHQNSMTYLVYPGASHKRFEHSLGVMHLAAAMFDVVTSDDRVTDGVREILPSKENLQYWKTVLKMAALCHDMGHLPFSHASEDLLPNDVTHEHLSRAFIESELMKPVWESITPPVKQEHVVKLALGAKKAKNMSFTTWEEILADLITGDIFGADRVDYLLRDSHHIGVAYGKFDHHRLIQSLKILTPPAMPRTVEDAQVGDTIEADETSVLELGVDRGGLESAEALQLARYFMFSQVYFHRVRLIYDIHLKDFLQAWLAGGTFPTDPERLLTLTDNEVMTALTRAAATTTAKGHEHAWRIVNRQHFKDFYRRRPDDVALFTEATSAIYEAAKEKFGAENVRYADGRKSGIPETFSVEDEGRVVASTSLSDAFDNLPQPKGEFVYIVPELRDKARKWVEDHGSDIVAQARKDEQEVDEEEKEEVETT